ncbi:TPA: NACHT domain-containing NTPase [Vibrio harveyi]|uniref:NACHT domain-containing protein n=1 Tax=Vibrio harveyi TaxID=669 RepID=UPI00390B78BE
MVSHSISDSFLEELCSTEINLHTNHKDHITLPDIYIYPDFKYFDKDKSDHDITRNSEFFSQLDKIPTHSLIIGEEQSGKSSFAKMLFKTSLAKNTIPILLKCREVNRSELDTTLKRAIAKQYKDLNFEEFAQSNKQKILILDDINEIRLNHKARIKFLSNIEDIFDTIVAISEDTILYEEEMFDLFEEYTQYEILPFGYERRDELFKRWHSLGREEEIDDAELIDLVDYTASNIDSIILKNIVPRKPIYILMLLLTLESTKSTDYSITSHGYCYQMLIQENLKKAKIKNDQVEQYINYLMHIAYYIYETGKYEITDDEFECFKKEYSKKFIIKSHDEVKNKLTESKILKIVDGKLSIRYKYIFYFYVAKYMAGHEDVIDFVDELCNKMHTEKNANILIFITHHTRSEKVIDKLIAQTTEIFKNDQEAKLGRDDTDFLKEFMDEIPKLVNQHIESVEDARKRKLKSKDDKEMRAQSSKESIASSQEIETNNKNIMDIARSVRSIEIIGQIIKNRYSSIELDQLHRLSIEAINVGLRFLGFYLTSTKSIKSELIEIIHKIIEQDSTLSLEEITAQSKSTFMHMVYGLSFNVIRKISNSIGHRELVELYSEIRNSNPTPALCLIDTSILLEFKSNKKRLPKKEIEEAWKTVDKQFLAKRLMQDIVLQHQYLNYVSYRDKSWVAEKLQIPLETQDKIQSDKGSKRLARSV